ncbi:GNAT family N-acetyltransferase [Phaeacidiphilus oryzae]|uniref:GNAT family N-acetyltransferase n=1 Tax=Phaeacidiphilus oryzae TaxID=348818 RepID=UPI00056A15E7|nr:GNAT family protein [Phaeacidiphilus oryzae]
MIPPVLTTARLVLRPLGAPDVDAVTEACQDPEIQRWTTVPSPYTRRDAETFVTELAPRGWAEHTLLNFGAFRRDDGALVSSIGLHARDLRHGEGIAEIGYWTATGQRGQGLTAEGVRAVCRWGFEELPVHRIEWLAVVGNEGSRAVAHRVGFHFEGTLRSRLLHRGERRDAWLGSLLPDDLTGGSPS